MATDDNINWKYEDETEAQSKHEPAGFEWSASEYIDHDRGTGWFMLLAAGSILLAAALYIINRDIMTPVIIALMGITVGAFAVRKPKTVKYELDSSGIIINGRQHSYHNFKSFSVVREGVIDSIMLTPLRRYNWPISAYFEPQDERKIVEILGQYLPMEQNRLDKVERLSRTLRF